MARPLVLPDDDGIRPAGRPDECFYCRRKVDQEHTRDCVMIQRKVRMRVTIEYDYLEPFSWDKDEIEGHRNHGTWCASNILSTLGEVETPSGCLCGVAKFEVVSMGEEAMVNIRGGDVVEVEPPTDGKN